jgi:hypothetical protein
LLRLFDAAESINGKLDAAMQPPGAKSLTAATAAIDLHLPCIEESFLIARHAALDLLRWTRRAGRIEGSTLPDEYRTGYARLVSYSPKFKPRFEVMQQKLLKLANASGTEGSVQAAFRHHPLQRCDGLSKGLHPSHCRSGHGAGIPGNQLICGGVADLFR